MHALHLELTFVLMFCAATAAAIAARWIRVPYTVALVLTGIALGATNVVHPPQLSKDLLVAIFLPGLVFEAAFHFEFAHFWRNQFVILTLAVPGVAASLPLIAVVLAAVTGPSLGFTSALLFAAIVVATDPVAVVAIFRTLPIPERLASVVEGESLLNDGTGVVAFVLVLSIATGAHPTALGVVGDLLLRILGGAAIGVVVGGVVFWITRRLDDAMIEVTLTVIAAYGAFGLAERLGRSGVIATAAAGLLCGSVAAKEGMTAATRTAANIFWDYVAFALNSVAFLLVGAQVEPQALLRDSGAILAAWLAVTVARAAVLYGVTALLRLVRATAHWKWTLIATWSGLRGALATTLALSLPRDLPSRALIVHMTFGVVLLTIVVQGLTLRPLIGWLGVAQEERASAS